MSAPSLEERSTVALERIADALTKCYCAHTENLHLPKCVGAGCNCESFTPVLRALVNVLNGTASQVLDLKLMLAAVFGAKAGEQKRVITLN